MRSPLQHENSEPLELRSNLILFHDWRYVNHGYPGWLGPDDKPVPLFNAEPLPAIHFSRGDIPFGLRLRALPAGKTEPFLSPEMPWEGIISAPTILREDGRYRLWYESVPPTMAGGGGANFLCLAESDDGLAWRRIEDAVLPYEGAKTNIVYGGTLAGPWGYHGGGVFVDPHGPASERFKAIYLVELSKQEAEAYRDKYPDRVAGWPPRGEGMHAAAGAVSPDGIHWTRLPEPLVGHLSDTHNTASFDPLLGKYVWFCRTWVLGRRAIGRAETDDFRRFPLPETIIWPGADVATTDTWYGNGKTVYPGTIDWHLLLPWRWRVAEDRFFTHLLTSPDGILWGAPPDNLVLRPGEFGAWDAGGTVSGCGMVELPGNRVGVPYVGYRIPHKYPRRPPLGQFAWAWWEKDRIVALEAAEEAEFSTWIVRFRGNELHLNLRTKHTGTMRVELLGPDRRPIPGRTLADCDPICGNHLDVAVTWRGDARLATGEPRPMAFHVRMNHAQLFSIRFNG